MNEKHEPGQQGYVRIPLSKKKFKGGVTAHGTIIEVDEKFILFQDNDEIEYLIAKSKFKFIDAVEK